MNTPTTTGMGRAFCQNHPATSPNMLYSVHDMRNIRCCKTTFETDFQTLLRVQPKAAISFFENVGLHPKYCRPHDLKLETESELFWSTGVISPRKNQLIVQLTQSYSRFQSLFLSCGIKLSTRAIGLLNFSSLQRQTQRMTNELRPCTACQ
jgi:hypothetical protein